MRTRLFRFVYVTLLLAVIILFAVYMKYNIGDIQEYSSFIGPAADQSIEWYESKTIVAFQYSTLLIIFVTVIFSFAAFGSAYVLKAASTEAVEKALRRIETERSLYVQNIRELGSTIDLLSQTVASLALTVSNSKDQAIAKAAYVAANRVELISLDPTRVTGALTQLAHVGTSEDYERMNLISEFHENPRIRQEARQALKTWKKVHLDNNV